MDELAAPLVRLDGSVVSVAVSLGCHASVYVDEGDPPLLVLDTGAFTIVVESARDDAGAVRVLAELVSAAQRLHAAVAARAESAAAVAGVA